MVADMSGKGGLDRGRVAMLLETVNSLEPASATKALAEFNEACYPATAAQSAALLRGGLVPSLLQLLDPHHQDQSLRINALRMIARMCLKDKTVRSRPGHRHAGWLPSDCDWLRRPASASAVHT